MRLTACMGACLAAATFASSAFAGPTVATAEASIRNLGFTVTDFRPDDGIAASATWLSGKTTASANWSYVVSDYNDITEQAGHLSNSNVFGSLPLNAELPSGQATAVKNASGLTASLNVDRSVFDGTLYYGYRNTSFGPVLNAAVNINDQGFRLTPGTEVAITGLFHLASSVNATSLSNLSLLAGLTAKGAVRIHASTNGYTYITSSDTYKDLQVIQSAPSSVSADAYQYVTATGAWNRGQADKQVDQSFSYVVRNNGTEAVSFWLTGSANTSFGADVATVSEPATWGLATAGLLMAVGLGRRRQAQA